MSRILAACAGFVAALVLTTAALGADTDCKLKRMTQLPAFLSPDNRIMAGVKINGTGTLLRIDTSDYTSLLFQAAVTKLGLNFHRATVQVETMDNRMLEYSTNVDSLSLGEETFKNAEFVLTPSAPSALQESGILSVGYLRSYDVEIDLADGVINFFDKDHCPGKVVYWAPSYSVTPFESEDMELAVELDGTQMHATVDTNTPQSTLLLADAIASFGLTSDSAGMQKQPDYPMLSGFGLPQYTYVFKTLKFGELTMHNPLVSILDNKPRGEKYSGSHIARTASRSMEIGMNVLSHLRMFISYSEHKLYYTIESRPPLRSLPAAVRQ